MRRSKNYRWVGGGAGAGAVAPATALPACAAALVLLVGCATPLFPSGGSPPNQLSFDEEPIVPRKTGNPLPPDPNPPAAGLLRLVSHAEPIDPKAPIGPENHARDWPSLQLADDGPLQRLALPSNDGPWSPDQAVLPWAEFHGNLVTVHNIRNSLYRTADDYTVRLYDKTFDLNRLTSVDFFMIPFNDNPAVAHVMISFGFGGQDYLVSSVEIRKRLGQHYSATAGFFNQFTLMYVLADERDVLWKNCVGFQAEAYLYRTKATPQQAKRMFVDVMSRVNKLVREPEFYNTLSNNCTTNIRAHINHLAPDRVPYDYHVLFPGYSDRLAYDLGLIETRGSFEETKVQAKINYRVYQHLDAPDFSKKIRE